jgi:hypothetical protein
MFLYNYVQHPISCKGKILPPQNACTVASWLTAYGDPFVWQTVPSKTDTALDRTALEELATVSCVSVRGQPGYCTRPVPGRCFAANTDPNEP